MQPIAGNDNSLWKPAICEKLPSDRSYIVKYGSKKYRRNRVHLRPRDNNYKYDLLADNTTETQENVLD